MGKLVAFGGFHMPDSDLDVLLREVELITEGFVGPDDEVKWSPPEGNPLRNLKEGERKGLYCRLLECAQRWGGRAIVVVIDTGRTSVQGPDALRLAVKYTFERLNTDLAKREEYGIVIPDQPSGGPRDAAAFLEDFVTLVRDGTEFSPGDKILLNALPSPSRFLRPLQIADLVTSVTTAMVGGSYRYARPIFEAIQPMLITNALDYAGGTGLKLFPDSLTNLYHWVLGENAFTKAASGLGQRLPIDGYPYADGEGV